MVADWTAEAGRRGEPIAALHVHHSDDAAWNAIDGPTHYLLVMTPRIHALIEALHAGDRSDYAQIFAEHDSELPIDASE